MDSPSVKRANRPKSRYYFTIDGTLWKRIDSRSTTMSVPDQEHVSADGHLKTPTTVANGDEASNELVVAVDNLIDFITEKFSKVTGEIFAKLDDMAQRLDELEASIKAGTDNHEGNQ